MTLLLKCIGGLLIFTACALGGFILSWRDDFRLAELAELRKALVLLKGEIQYARTPLSEAFESVAARADKQTAAFFLSMAAQLSEKSGESAAVIWNNALHDLRKSSHLAEEDLETLALLGRSFGYLDGATQAEGLDMAMAYIDEKAILLQEKSAKTGRMYRSVGLLCGALVVIALI